jgi:serine/threonine protein phosphatase PrpC
MLTYALVTDRGLVHTRNEDRCGAFIPEDPRLRDERGHLFVLADGVGGSAAGDVAAELAVHAIKETYFSGPWDGVESALRTAFANANAAVLARARESGWKGMSATTVVAALVADAVTVAHLGDVRAYLLREGQARRLTSDHSWVQERLDAGLISPDEARAHPHRNVVTHALGIEFTARPDVVRAGMQTGDVLLLCSDGRWGLVEDQEMAGMVAETNGPAAAARALVDLALARGGHDNISVIVVRAIASTSVSPTGMMQRRPPS